MPGHRMARILALGVALTTVGCSVLARPSAETTAEAASPLTASGLASPLAAVTAAAPESAAGTGGTPLALQTLVAGSSVPTEPASSPAGPSEARPAGPTLAPMPSRPPGADPTLEAMIPTTGWPAMSYRGAETPCCREIGLMFLPGPPGAFVDYLGTGLDRMTFAMGFYGSATAIRALRVRGADPSRFVGAWLALVDVGWRLPLEGPGYVIPGATMAPVAPYTSPTKWQMDLAGKKVTGLFFPEGMGGADMLEFLYAHGDVLFVVTDVTYSPWDTSRDPTADEKGAIAELP